MPLTEARGMFKKRTLRTAPKPEHKVLATIKVQSSLGSDGAQGNWGFFTGKCVEPVTMLKGWAMDF